MLPLKTSLFFVLMLAVCASCRTSSNKSHILASEAESEQQDFMQAFFAEINELAASDKPISADFTGRASLGVQSAHEYFGSMYKKSKRMSIWTQLKQLNSPSKTLDTFKQLMEQQDAAEAMGIRPDNPWAGGGEQKWIRYFPKEALDPSHWNDYRKREAPYANEMDPIPKYNYFFFGRDQKEFGMETWYVDSTRAEEKTNVIVAAGDIRIRHAGGVSRFENCIVIANGNVEVGHEMSYCVIIAAGDIILKAKMVSSTLVAGGKIQGTMLRSEGLMSFAKAHVLASKLELIREQDSTNGVFKDYYVKIQVQPEPMKLIGAVADTTLTESQWNRCLPKKPLLKDSPYRASNSCPEGYVKVAANEEYGVKDFCVMRHEASKQDDLSLTPVSIAGRVPWHGKEVSRDNASRWCASLGAGFSLISNAQWQTIAQNIENATDSSGLFINWSNGSKLGENNINMGKYNLQDSTLQEVQTGWFPEKRSHILSGGEKIWDISGSADELMCDIPKLADEAIPHGSLAMSDLTKFPIIKKLFGPKSDYSFKSTNINFGGGLGSFYVSWYFKKYGIYRGSDGIFGVGENIDDVRSDTGFRCVMNFD